MARKRERIGAFIIALFFLVATLGATGVIIWQVITSKSDPEVDLTQPAAPASKLNDFTPLPQIEALQSIDLVTGSGEAVRPGVQVTVHYSGALASDGAVFDSSYLTGQPASFRLIEGEIIKGWVDGLIGMKVGGKRRLLIPAELAYGPEMRSGIPPDSDLVFDVELLQMQQ